MDFRKLSLKILLITSFFLSLVTAAVAQLAVGTISGTVQDASGAVIPGVSISLSSVGVVGGNQTAVTDERGVYRLIRLVPGTYGVRAELPGFRPAARENIIVNADVTVRVDLKMEVGEVTDTVTVTGEAPLLDTTTALNQAVLDRQALDALPTGNDLWSIGRLVPGVIVSKYDVGGSESFQQSSLSIHGNSDNVYAIDGMDVAWSGGSGGGVMVYFDTSMFEEVNYQVGSISAESARGGVVMNMVTKTGTNAFRGAFMFTGSAEKMNSSNLTPALTRDLLAGIPARALAANPNLVPQAKILGFFDSSLTLSGPIARDKLWFTSTGKLNSLNQLALGSYNPDGTQGVDDNRIINGSAKVSWQATPGNQLHFTYSRNLKYRYHRRVATFSDQRSADLQDQPADIYQLKWTSTLSSKLVMDMGASLQVGETPGRQQPEVQIGDLARMDLGTNTATVAAGSNGVNPQYKAIANGSLSWFAGAHDLKMGYQFGQNMNSSKSWSMSHFPSGIRANYRNGVPESVTQYATPGRTRSMWIDHALFIQDKWTVTRKLVLNFGLRFQDTYGWNPALCRDEGLFVPARCFGKLGGVPNWTDLSPRLSAVYDVFGDGRTAIKLSANHYNEGIGSSYPARVAPTSASSRVVDWFDRNGDLLPQDSELGAGNAFEFGTNNRYQEGIKRPINDEYSVGVQHELPFGLVASVSYTHRENWRTIAQRNLSNPGAINYIPIQITIPTTVNGFPVHESAAGKTTTIWNLKPEFRAAPADNLSFNSSHNATYYNGMDFAVNKRMSDGWMMVMGLTLNYGRRRPGVDLADNPNDNRFPGGKTDLPPVSFKMSGSYDLPLGISLTAAFLHETGDSEGQTFVVTRAMVPSLTNNSLTIPLINGNEGLIRKPDVNLTDLSIRKSIRIGENVRFSPNLELFNLFNTSAIQGRITELGTAYGRVSSIIRGRLIRTGFDFNF